MRESGSGNSQSDRFSQVRETIDKIIKKTQDEDYIYRGESECFERVCSGLYRAYAKLEVKEPDLLAAKQEKSILERARKYLDKTENKVLSSLSRAHKEVFGESSSNSNADQKDSNVDQVDQEKILEILEKATEHLEETEDRETLVQLQHYGCPTNLIDFTNDYLIALFFACYHSPHKDGRIIFMNRAKPPDDCKVIEIPPIINRIRDQKSLFVQATKGFIEIGKYCQAITIPADLKNDLKSFLQSKHGVSVKTVYDDIHGFIQSLETYFPIYQMLHEAQIIEEKGDSADSEKERRHLYAQAIESYDEILETEEELWEAYYQRGGVYFKMGKYSKAIENYDKAEDQYRNDAKFFANRGNAYYLRRNVEADSERDVEAALKNYEKAITLEPDNAVFYEARYQIFIEQGKWKEALMDINRLAKLGHDVPEDIRQKVLQHVD